MFNLFLRIYNLFKNFLLSKLGIAIFCLILGILSNKFINYLNNQENASKSTIANFQLWLNNSKQQVSKVQIFKFDGKKFVKEISSSIDNKIDNGQNKFLEIKQSIIKKLTWQISPPKDDSYLQNIDNSEPKTGDVEAKKSVQDSQLLNNQELIKNSQTKPVIKTSEIRKYEDQYSFSYDLVLQGYRYEEVVIAISNNQLSFSNSLSHKAVIEISSSNLSQQKNKNSSTQLYNKNHKIIDDFSKKSNTNQGFSYVLDLDKYDHKIDPEITYHENIITVKFFKLKK